MKNIDKTYSFFYKIAPFSSPLYWYKGEANFYQNNINQAFQNFKIAYSQNPYHIHVLNNLGTCYTLKNNNYKAIFFYKKAIEISPKFDKSQLNTSAVYNNQNNFDSAFYYFSIIDTNYLNSRYYSFITPLLQNKIKTIISKITDKKQKKFYYVFKIPIFG
ncbi:MAG: hypothetical protein JXR68_03825 [Bacteroidales bacterium]|nr:hypothetical protein [Bacteroidales bacterium]